MWLIIFFTIFVCTLIADYFYKRGRYHLLKVSGLKGLPYTLPIFGDLITTLGFNTLSVFNFLEHWSKKLGKVYYFWVLNCLMLVVRDPKYFEVILSSQSLIRKSFLYQTFSLWLGDGLLLSFGGKWHARRKILTPTYHFKILEEFVEVFDRASDVLVKKLAAKADGKTAFNVYPYICLTALDIISETSMGVEIKAQEHPDFPYAKAVQDATEIMGNRISKPFQYYDITYLLSALPTYLKLRKCVKTMHDFTSKVIIDRRAKIKADSGLSTYANQDGSEVGQKKRMVFLDVLLQATINGQPLSNDEVREEVDTFMFEGHDTTTSAISFCLYLLSRHGEIQQKAFEEVVQILSDDKLKPITMRDLNDLKYLEAVIKESLRLFPSVPMIGREVEEDIKIGNEVIPAKTNVALLIYAAGRDPDYFDNPDDFNPDRFYSESPDKINPFAYVPFSAGPRNCIGQKFAMLEIKSTISKVLRYYELLPLGKKVKPTMSLVLRSANGVHIGLRPRKF